MLYYIVVLGLLGYVWTDHETLSLNKYTQIPYLGPVDRYEDKYDESLLYWGYWVCYCMYGLIMKH